MPLVTILLIQTDQHQHQLQQTRQDKMACFHRISVITFAILIIYFTWMDIQLYFTVQSTTISKLYIQINSTSILTTKQKHVYNIQLTSSSSSQLTSILSDKSNYCNKHLTISSIKSSDNTNNNIQLTNNVPQVLYYLNQSENEQRVFYSPFNEFSVKLAMLDQVDNYIYSPLAELFHNYFDIANNYPCITPNMISFIGVCFATMAAYLVYRGKKYHKLAVLVFQVSKLTI